MSNELMPYGAPKLPAAPRTTTTPLTRQGRAIARQDRSTELQAREDLNHARLAVHRTHLESIVEKAKNQSRAELAEDVMLHARAVDDLVTSLSAGKPALELSLREIQAAYMTGETQRIIRRGIGI
ncbi:hypothetical protein [Mycobacteroides abscessus]|uniref:hypothetical protein n=1 Tax=Mycobacteroides abscessus TaxID=36809 RepID=UPI00092CC1DE|nr:hypothetical protein [Mycobacteroides abscessus]SIC58789.1 Uncharacterised protein [Mycobacteroides abscessus subsp. abscessus]